MTQKEMLLYIKSKGWTEQTRSTSVYRFEDPLAEGSYYKLKDAYDLAKSREGEVKK